VTARTGRAVGYVRVSTDQQAESGLGLEAQEAALSGAASRLRLDLVKVFVDAGTSGKLAIEDRPVLLDAVATLKRGDVLLVAKRDRLGRDVIAVAMIERLVTKRGARVVSAAGEGTETDDPAALLMRRLIDSFAEYERALIAARTRAALAAKRRRGERVSGQLPFGYTLAADGRTLDPHDGEQRTLARIRALRTSGRSMQAIADALNADGVRTRAGSIWRFEYVRGLLRQRPIPSAMA
jgi:DNA invertase Pin-like site-specific DNA recombinase